MLIGYARVSTGTQTTDPQVARLLEAGVDRRNLFIDVCTGKAASRPNWDKCLEHLRPGDVLKCTKLDRIGRSVKNLIEVVSLLADRGCDLVVLDQPVDTTTATGRLFFNMVAAFSEFEADLISERTRDGLAVARARGHLGGRKPVLSSEKVALVKKLYDEGRPRRPKYTAQEIASLVGCSRTTVFQALKQAS